MKQNKYKNKYGYKGVSFNKAYGKFVSIICFDKQRRFLGYWNTPEEAGLAYNKAALRLIGKDAVLNDIPEQKAEIMPDENKKSIVTLSNIEIIFKDHRTLTYQIIGEDKHYRMPMSKVKNIRYKNGQAIVTVRV